MTDSPITVKPIGVIKTPFTRTEGTPIQPFAADGAKGLVEIYDEYANALQDLDGFERIWLLYSFDRTCKTKLKVVPFRDTQLRGVFSTRAPCRPNLIGMSVVKLLGIDGTTLRVADVDMLDGTPLLDIKPYIPHIDSYEVSRCGWFDKGRTKRDRADGRFTDKG
ncbi:MAG: tRNA (N6-threonylcarbamoyladenosine(37)-N6)-methyltransferase TrmO [Candidatus Zixiibacteriota bacterium]|nr:MAG: tRNA (N6-threonylcarbamoyladenosine(37)-N6)-methyltransferase TrmO [candidate division Zixibacteria bacterium]